MPDLQREYYLSLKTNAQTIICLLLLITAPPTVISLWYINTALGGSFAAFGALIQEHGLLHFFKEVWWPIFFGTAAAWKILGAFAGTQLAFMKLVPGATVLGPLSPQGETPVYKANGLPCFFLTLGLFAACTYQWHLFPATIIYDNFGALLSALNIFSLLFCAILYIKGRIAPSSRDAGTSGHFIFDYYWGVELYPRIFGWDVKMFTNCRFALMSWPLILLSFAAKQQQLYGLSDSMIVAVALQMLYVAKFFYWETGYLRSLDIMHDKAGYYICWGCLVWVPGVYTSSTLYLVNHPNHLGPFLSLLIFFAGTLAIGINFLADRQRQKTRDTDGDCMIWGKPPETLRVKYKAQDGAWKENLLLLSGWWGISRHFHYVPEIIAAFCWSAPALFDHFMPYFYVIFLTILLVERAFRDDKRCADKYGKGWDEYCKIVPYKILPFVI